MANQYEKRKAKDDAERALAKEVQRASLVYDKIAYDIFYDEELRKFMRVTVEYNLEEGIGRVKETKAIADSQPVAIYKMSEAINRKVLRMEPKLED